MNKITFDTGIHEFEVNGNGVLRFNPSDPNLYNRFLDATEDIKGIEKELEAKAQSYEADENGEGILRIMREADSRVKVRLHDVFGHENDFDKLLGGVNVLAMTKSGSRVITNLLGAITPIISEGAERYIDDKVSEVKYNRATRRAMR